MYAWPKLCCCEASVTFDNQNLIRLVSPRRCLCQIWHLNNNLKSIEAFLRCPTLEHGLENAALTWETEERIRLQSSTGCTPRKCVTGYFLDKSSNSSNIFTWQRPMNAFSDVRPIQHPKLLIYLTLSGTKPKYLSLVFICVTSFVCSIPVHRVKWIPRCSTVADLPKIKSHLHQYRVGPPEPNTVYQNQQLCQVQRWGLIELLEGSGIMIGMSQICLLNKGKLLIDD